MKSILQKYLFLFIAAPLCAVCICLTFIFSKWLFAVELILFVAICFGYILYTYVQRVNVISKVHGVTKQLTANDREALKALPFCSVCFEPDGTILWFNRAFSDKLFSENEKAKQDNIFELLQLENIKELCDSRKIQYENLSFYGFCTEIKDKDDKSYYLLILDDITKLSNTEKQYHETRPYVMMVAVDTIDEIYQTFKESECGAIFGRIEEIVDNYAIKHNSVCRKLSTGRYMILVYERDFVRMSEDKFKLLEYVRNLSYADKKINSTLSIGIGRESSLYDSDDSAKYALDMAQSRGGDQAAIKTGNDYQFYGGVSVGYERSNKIRARVVANSFCELIEGSENVMVMGHRFADLDAFGAAMGIFAIAKAYNKTVNICINREIALAKPLIAKFDKEGYADKLVSPDKAKYMVSQNTLLVVVDTHKADFTECPELLLKTKKIVIIDHHRKSVNSIQNPVLFFHTSYASSASEMVTEIVEYSGKSCIQDKLIAEGLLSGITLDTRNFVLRTGVRTFEAAAYLRSKGADTVEVKKLFSNDYELNKSRNQIVDSAYSYEHCAISVTESDNPEIRLITSQAADELLNLEGVKGSFVIFKNRDTVCISARSFGDMNVQVIMEKFGGGGHSTMAAAQMENTDIQTVSDALKKEISAYFQNI